MSTERSTVIAVVLAVALAATACSGRVQATLEPDGAPLDMAAVEQLARTTDIRRGWMAVNPVTQLEPAEKPRWSPGRVGVFEGPALARVLDHAGWS